MSSSPVFLFKFVIYMRLRSTCGNFCGWFCWIWLFCKLSCFGCVVLLFSSKWVCLIIGVVMISFLESNSFFKFAIFSCNVLVFWVWQHYILATVLLIFSKYYSNFSCIAVSLFSKWRVSSVSNCSKVSVFCCAEGLGICLTFCNKGFWLDWELRYLLWGICN